ncbi:MAG: hypothetical protein ACRC3Y_00600 [Romboutsia sp.]|uniref:hypothetical protein n=1 Tax=Romboutsia sp. TaxID=1965302 RepID=UPI003F2B62A1
MNKKDCNRRNTLLKELCNDWDHLNLAFKSLIIIGIVLFIAVITIAFFSNGGTGLKNSIEVVFRSTLASVFGFLLSSNIKDSNRNKNEDIIKIKYELQDIQEELEQIDKETNNSIYKDNCDEEVKKYGYEEGNLVQITIALTVCLVSIIVISIIFITNNVENVPAVSQIRDLMCSSIGFLLGESSRKTKA